MTGNPAADLETQLEAVLTYNQQWASYLPALNDAASPADAASIYVTDFERAGIPAAQHPRGLGRGRRQRLRHLAPPPSPATSRPLPHDRSRPLPPRPSPFEPRGPQARQI